MVVEEKGHLSETMLEYKCLFMTESMLTGNTWLLKLKMCFGSFIYAILCSGSSLASHVEHRPLRFLLKGVIHDTTLTVKCTWLEWAIGDEDMEKALVFNGGTNCTSHSNGIWTDGKSSNTYIRKIKSLISSGACKEKKKSKIWRWLGFFR